MAGMAVECVADVQAVLGEGPVWVAREAALYWLDIHGRKIFRLDEAGENTTWPTPLRVGSIAPRACGGFIAGTEQGIAVIDLDADRFDIRFNPEAHLPNNRFNDGKVDRAGNFWTGTMDDREGDASGALYRIDPDLSCTRIDEGYRVTNGPAFSPAGDLMYHNDSARRVTYAFDLDAAGTVANRRIFREFGEAEGFPDGMTVDAEGCLWIAFWDGWCVRRFSPEAKLLEQINLPVARPTSCAFGGPALGMLYVTSARIGLGQAKAALQPYAGGLFRIDAGVSGIAERMFAG